MKQLWNRWFGRRGAAETKNACLEPDAATESQPEAERLIMEGNVLEDAGQLAAAEAQYRAALKLCPDFARGYVNLGNVQAAQEQPEAAAASYRTALRLKPGYGAAHVNLGRLYLYRRDYQNAAEHYAQAVQLMPDSADALVGLGGALEELQRQTEAEQVYRRALEVEPGFPGAHLNLGQLLVALKRPDEGLEHLEEALSRLPDSALGHFMLGNALGMLGFTAEAMARLEQALHLQHDHENAAGLMLFLMNFRPNYSTAELFAAHLDYVRRFCARFYPENLQYVNVPDPERPLKVGYVSGDFRIHPVSRFVKAVFVYHDRASFKIYGFYNHYVTDAVTEQFKGLVDQWYSIGRMTDADAAQLVRKLGIDILVDLSGHTDFHRLQLFARKPAPVQVTWLGYLGTTGLATMDYRICDTYTNPPGLTEAFHTEQLARLPDCQWCYTPNVDLPPVGKLPMLGNGYPILGSFNNPPKLNDQVLELWAEVLNIIPQARLRLAAVLPGRAEDRVASILNRLGVALERIEFMPRLPYRDYLASISAVDLALDPFPYNGGTTSMETLVMGVPLVTLAGDHSVARGGVSLLSNLGLAELIAATPQDYVEIVRRLINNPARLAALRGSLRERMQASPLMDGARFTRNLEALYRSMWRAWCKTQGVGENEEGSGLLPAA
ncbi:MAG: tetratricopeptide repeat protein [Candidatus Competibacteraceae bacterium]